MLWACCDDDSKTALLVGVSARGAWLISIDRQDDDRSLQDKCTQELAIGSRDRVLRPLHLDHVAHPLHL